MLNPTTNLNPPSQMIINLQSMNNPPSETPSSPLFPSPRKPKRRILTEAHLTCAIQHTHLSKKHQTHIKPTLTSTCLQSPYNFDSKSIESLLKFNDHRSKAISLFKQDKSTYIKDKIFLSYLKRLEPFNEIFHEHSSNSNNHSPLNKDKFNHEQILKNLALNLRNETFNANRVIYKYGDIADKYYVILDGKVDIIVPNEEEILLTEEEYYLYLLKLRQFNEIEILNKVILKNKSVFTIEESNFDMWVNTAYNTVKFIKGELKHGSKVCVMSPKKTAATTPKGSKIKQNQGKFTQYVNNYQSSINNNSNSSNNVVYVFEAHCKRQLVMKLEKEIVNTMYIINPKLHPEYQGMSIAKAMNIIKSNNDNVSSIEYISRTKPIAFVNGNSNSNNEQQRKRIRAISYFIADTLTTGNKFGDLLSDTNDSNINNNITTTGTTTSTTTNNNTYPSSKNISSSSTRELTIITKHPCEFGILDKPGYNKCLHDITEKMRKIKVIFLLNLEIFNGCDQTLFMKNFSNFFRRKLFHYGESLFTERESLSNRCIYFIKEGEFRTHCYKSISQLNKLFLSLNYTDVVDPQDEDPSLKEIHYLTKHEPSIDQSWYMLLHKQHPIKLLYFNDNDVLGLNDSIVNDEYIYTATCCSQVAIVYEIHINFFKVLVNMDVNVNKNVMQYETIKRNLLVKHLLKYRKSKIDFYNYYDKSDMDEPRFGCLKFKKGEKDQFKELLILKNVIKDKRYNNSKNATNNVNKRLSMFDKEVSDIIKKRTVSKKNEKKCTRVINAYVLKSDDNKGNTVRTSVTNVSAVGNNSTTLPKLDISALNEGVKGRNYWNTITNRSGNDSEKKDNHVVCYSNSNFNNTMKTLSVSIRNNKTRLLLPRKIKPPLNEQHTRKFLTNELDSFYDNTIHKNIMVFNLTNKNLYKKAPSSQYVTD